MGLDPNSLRLLQYAMSDGASLERVLTVGRLDTLLRAHHIARAMSVEVAEAQRLAMDGDRYCEPVLQALGAGSVDSLDVSSFEGASIVHDLNKPMPDDLAERYTLVLDGGTLEHVFNFTEALRSCMNLLEVGGYLLMVAPTNNQMGHGLYQFSPDLFWRALSADNGFEIRAMFLAETFSDGPWHQVADPAVAQERVGHNFSATALSLLVVARRVVVRPIFATAPQQSDYAAAWTDGRKVHRLAFFDKPQAKPGVARRLARRAMPGAMRRLRKLVWAGRRALRSPDSRFFDLR